MTKQNSKSPKNHQSLSGGLKSAITHNNSVQPNSELLRTLKFSVPQFFEKDVYDENGNLVKIGNFKTDQFLDEIKSNNIIESRDGYKLGFVGKDYARLQTGRLSETMIVPDTKHNSKNENINSNNIFITGDNLEALRHLQNAYAGKIKMIYIDPPYNTGKEFTYNDTFEFNDEQLKTALGYSDEEIDRLKSIQGKSSHSAWLTFMYPRLKLAQKLLTDDGVIFVSIDDNEQANLKLLLDDIFGEGDFVCQFNWIKTATPPALSKTIRRKLEYILCHAHMLSSIISLNGGIIDGGDMPLLNEGNTLGILEFPANVLKLKLPDGVYKSGRYEKVSLLKDFAVKNGVAQSPLILEGHFKWSQETLNREIKDKTFFWIKTNKFAVRYERQEKSQKTPANIISKVECDVGTNEDAQKEILDLFNTSMMDYPKPTSLIKYLANMIIDRNDIILDFFAGSGTTAHAVMQLNAEDGGNRKFILVQLDEPTKLDSEAQKAGYNTIDEIARERIKRAAKKIKSEKELTLSENFDGGFKHFRLVTPDVKTLDKIIEFNPDDIGMIADDMITPFADKKMGTNGLDTLLTTWLIDDGYTFDTDIEIKNFAGYAAHYTKESATLYLINQGWNKDASKELLNQIGKNKLIVGTIILYSCSFTFVTLRELKTNIKTNLDNPPTIIERY